MTTMVKTSASQTGAQLGARGANGDYLDFILVIPATVSPGSVAISTNTLGAATLFAGGTGSVSSLIPFPIPVQQYSLDGGWTITTGAAVSTISFGNFT